MNDTSEQETSLSFRRRFFRIVCGFENQLFVLFALEVALLFLTGYSVLVTGFDGASGVIILLNIIILGSATSMTVGLLVFCRRERTTW